MGVAAELERNRELADLEEKGREVAELARNRVLADLEEKRRELAELEKSREEAKLERKRVTAELERRRKENNPERQSLAEHKRHLKRDRQVKVKAIRHCSNIIEKHGQELRLKRRDMILDLGYGRLDDTRWRKEKKYFIENILRSDNVVQKNYQWLDLDSLIEECCRTNTATRPPPHGNPIAFEQYCAGLLSRAGWDSSTTKASGDQGADICAKFGTLSIVLQCKQYSHPVGNKAVQEVRSAKDHYMVKFAAVVASAGYTQSAKDLARTNDVLLLQPEDLPSLASKLRQGK